MDFSRIKDFLAHELLAQVTLLFVGVGGAADFVLKCIRSGARKIKVYDPDRLEACNVTRTIFNSEDIGMYKVEALEKMARRIDPTVQIEAYPLDFLAMNDEEVDLHFQAATIIIMTTDNHLCQAKGNKAALRNNKPLLHGGWYPHGRVGEIFFQIPGVTPACYRCAVSSRYEQNELSLVPARSSQLSIFHGDLMNSYMGFVLMAMLHRGSEDWTHHEVIEDNEAQKRKRNSAWLDTSFFDYNFLQISVHPETNFLFDRAYSHLGNHAFNFQTYWQRIEPELPEFGFDYICPDCQGKLYQQTLTNEESTK